MGAWPYRIEDYEKGNIWVGDIYYMRALNSYSSCVDTSVWIDNSDGPSFVSFKYGISFRQLKIPIILPLQNIQFEGTFVNGLITTFTTDMSYVLSAIDPICVEQAYTANYRIYVKLKDINGDGLYDFKTAKREFTYEYSPIKLTSCLECYDTGWSTYNSGISVIYDPPTFAEGNTQAGAARTAAEAARIAAENTVSYAQQAAANATNAYNAAYSANTNAANAANNTWYSGNTAGYWSNLAANRALDATNAVNTAQTNINSNTNTAINSLKSDLTTSKTDINNNTNTAINNAVTNIQNSIKNAVEPEIKSVKGLNGATCTKSGQFTVVISAKNATQYRAYVDSVGGAWGTNKQITLSVPAGPHVIYVQAKNDTSTTIAEETMTVFGL